MNNAAAATNDTSSRRSPSPSRRSSNKNPHAALLQHFTGHLDGAELQYFRDWDRLIDLEDNVRNHEITNAWLVPSVKRETLTGRCISSLVLHDGNGSGNNNNNNNDNDKSARSESIMQQPGGQNTEEEHKRTITFRRSGDSVLKTPLNSLKLEIGNRLILSTDGTSIHPAVFDRTTGPSSSRVKTRHRMNVLKGVLKHIDETDISIGIDAGDLKQLLQVVHSHGGPYQGSNQPSSTNTTTAAPATNDMEKLHFRLDKEEYTGGAKVLRQNLLNLFTVDIQPFSPPTTQKTQRSKTQEAPPSDIQLKLKHRMPRLRRSIIHFEPPRYEKKLMQPLFSPPGTAPRRQIDGCRLMDLSREFSQLNKDQKAAVIKVSGVDGWMDG